MDTSVYNYLTSVKFNEKDWVLMTITPPPRTRTRSTTDNRTRDYEPKTPFQRFLKPLLVANAQSSRTPSTYQELYPLLLAKGVTASESYIYRIVRGDPIKFPNAKRPGYALALAIGEIFGDAEGALAAADYPAANTQVVAENDDSGRTRVVSHDTMRLIDGYESLPESSRATVQQVIKTLNATRNATEIDVTPPLDGGILAPGQILIADAREELFDSRPRQHPLSVQRPTAEHGADRPGVASRAGRADMKDNPA